MIMGKQHGKGNDPVQGRWRFLVLKNSNQKLQDGFEN